MKETLLSNCERRFISKSMEEYTRLDGRNLLEARPLKIYFRADWGCCIVSLGQTRVAAEVTCDIQQPKTSRPNEGMIHINVELTPLAAQHFESSRQSEATVLINRQLEKCIKDSNCIDLEALCIIADKKVWNLRVDINILNHDGNLIDCASIAALAALMHFHRPDVTSTGESIIVHPFSEKDPLPLTLFHHPLCVSFITLESGATIMDPTYIEERVGVACTTIGLNAYDELCSLNFHYLTKTLTVQDVISVVLQDAAAYAKSLVEQIKAAVGHDVQARYKKDDSGTCRFKNCIETNRLTTMANEFIRIKLRKWDTVRGIDEMNASMDQDGNEESYIIQSKEGLAELINKEVSIGEGGPNTWKFSESSESEASDIEVVPIKEKNEPIDNIELSGDSEEETTDVVGTDDLMK